VRENSRRCKDAVAIDEHSVNTRLYYYIYRAQGINPCALQSFLRKQNRYSRLPLADPAWVSGKGSSAGECRPGVKTPQVRSRAANCRSAL